MDDAGAILRGARGPLARWLAAGLVFMGVNTGLLYLFVRGMGLGVPLATLLSAEACTLLRYLLNEWWVFGTAMLSRKRLWQYHAANAGAFIIWWAATNALARGGMNYLLASILAVGFSTGFSLASNFLWIWRRKHASPASMASSVPRAHRKVVAGIILLRADGAALLQLRDEKPTIQDPGIWVVPGGHIEAGESHLEGARREFQEETRYVCADPRPLAQYSSRSLGYPDEFDLVFFWDRFDGVQEIECREGQDLKFIGRSQAEGIPRRDYLTKVWDLALSACADGQDVVA